MNCLRYLFANCYLWIDNLMRRICPDRVTSRPDESTRLVDTDLYDIPEIEMGNTTNKGKRPMVHTHVDALRSKKRWSSKTTCWYIPETTSVLIHFHPLPHRPTEDRFFTIPSQVIRCMEMRMRQEITSEMRTMGAHNVSSV